MTQRPYSRTSFSVFSIVMGDSPEGHSVSIQQMDPARPSQNMTKFAPDVGQTSK